MQPVGRVKLPFTSRLTDGAHVVVRWVFVAGGCLFCCWNISALTQTKRRNAARRRAPTEPCNGMIYCLPFRRKDARSPPGRSAECESGDRNHRRERDALAPRSHGESCALTGDCG